MLLRRSEWVCGLGVILAAALTAVPGRAGEVDKYLPDDTEMVASINVRQILDSDLFKKYAREAAEDALKNLDELQDAFKDLGFDPFKDLDRVIVAAPRGTDQDRGLAILHGRFDADKFKAKGEQMVKDNPDEVKVHKVPDGAGGKFLIYEVKVPNQSTPVFLALVNKTTLLASPGKDYVVDALKKEKANVAPALKNKDIQGLIEKMNDKQGVSVAIVGSALTEGSSDDIKALFQNIDAVGGGLTVGDEIKIEIAVSAKGIDAAKEVKDSLNTNLKQARALLAGLSLAFPDQPEIDALADVVGSFKVLGKDKTIVIKGIISTDALEEALKKDKK